MTKEEVKTVKRLFGDMASNTVIRLNHRNNILSTVTDAMVTKQTKGLVRAQYTTSPAKYTFMSYMGPVRILLTAAATIPMLCLALTDGSMLIVVPSRAVKSLVADYKFELERLGLGTYPTIAIDDPRSINGAAYYGSLKQLSFAEIEAGNKILREFWGLGEKSVTETAAYKTLSALLPIDKVTRVITALEMVKKGVV